MMKNKIQHSDEFKKQLTANKKEIIDYLQKKTGYNITLRVEYDKELGYRYSARVSLDGFDNYSKWMLISTNKTDIKKELQAKILNVDWQNKKVGQSILKNKAISKAVNSSAKTLVCHTCEESKDVVSFHRNIHNALWNKHFGYSFICHDCAIQEFLKIYQERDLYMGFIYLCSLYNRQFKKDLIDRVKKSALNPHELVTSYFSQLNLRQYKGKLFIDSDTFDFNEVNN